MQTLLEFVQIGTLIALIIYVIKTWHMASATKEMAEASRETLQEMKESRDLLIRPYVTVYFDRPPGQTWFDLVIENTGSGAARNINLKFDPVLESSSIKNLMDLEIFKNGIPFLAPHQKFRVFFDVGVSIFSKEHKDLPRKYLVDVIYQGGLENALRRENYTLDLSIYEKLAYIRRKSLHELVEIMEKILKQMQKC